MHELSPLYIQTLMLLAGAVIAAPLFKWAGLGTVLGYLFAGLMLGVIAPLLFEPESILRLSELGVVMLLFVIGLELRPALLWSMRMDIFALGGLQVLLCGLALTPLAMLLVPFPAALAIGLGLALSSTAFAMQVLEENDELRTAHGSKAFAILLFQDLSIVPLLALLPLLAGMGATLHWGEIGLALLAVAALLVAGRFLLNPIFRYVARAQTREVMIAITLLLVLGAAALMQLVGLSMALGAFIAGVMLADSEYRHELEADIEPFRGLLLGLFFMAIGMSIDLPALARQWPLVLGLVLVATLVKAVVIYGVCRLMRSPHGQAVRVSAVLTQHGEFGFVLFAAAVGQGILTPEQNSILTAVVVLSMALTPLVRLAGERVAARGEAGEAEMDEDFAGAQGSPVLMIGFSRMGQVAAQVLLATGQDVTVIDNDPEMIAAAQRFAFRIYFGDGRRADVLRAAGIEDAEIVAICIAGEERVNEVVDLVARTWPDKKIFVRSFDRRHTLELMERGVTFEMRETFESALRFGGRMVEELGWSRGEVREIVEDIRRRDATRLERQREAGKMEAGRDLVHKRPVNPEPLVAVRRRLSAHPPSPEAPGRDRGQETRESEESSA